MDKDLWAAFAGVGVFALGAVALILYQHSQHTGQITAALGAGSSTGSGVTAGGASLASLPSGAASLGGQATAIVGSGISVPLDNSSPFSVQPLDSGPGWSIAG